MMFVMTLNGSCEIINYLNKYANDLCNAHRNVNEVIRIVEVSNNFINNCIISYYLLGPFQLLC